MSRWKAAALHLGISAIIAGIATGLLLGVWYPPPYFRAGGAGHLLALVVGVDVAIGPFITLLVFRHGKRGMKFDLVVIALLQATALVYGFHIIVSSRPVFLAAAVDRFVLVSAEDIADKDLAQASEPQWRHLSWTGPVLVGTRLPTDAKEHNALLFESLREGKDVQDYPKYYVPYAAAVPGLLKHAKRVRALIALYPAKAGNIKHWLKQHHVAPANARWLPIQARDGDLTMMVKAGNGQPIGALALNPWPDEPAPAHAGSS